MYKKYRVVLKRKAVLSSAPHMIMAGTKEEAIEKAKRFFCISPREAGDSELDFTTFEGETEIEVSPMGKAQDNYVNERSNNYGL
ncbi:MAG: hypothetical protein K6F27_09715 [Ruminococcus sp.]|nr:hypothetical protein [Ruminococcus sp.]